MRSVCLLLVLLLAPLSQSDAATCEPGERSELPVAMHSQETGLWCWAASSQMVMAYLGHNQSQCDQANNRLSRGDCLCSCTGGPKSQNPNLQPLDCVQPGWPELSKYGFSYDHTCNRALSWDELRQQLSTNKNCRGTPVLFSWRYKGERGGGHMMVAKGYRTVNGENYVSVLDPWPPCPVCKGSERIIPYKFYVDRPDQYMHWHDFYNITYTRK
jgi:hypothetical protein